LAGIGFPASDPEKPLNVLLVSWSIMAMTTIRRLLASQIVEEEERKVFWLDPFAIVWRKDRSFAAARFAFGCSVFSFSSFARAPRGTHGSRSIAQ